MKAVSFRHEYIMYLTIQNEIAVHAHADNVFIRNFKYKNPINVPQTCYLISCIVFNFVQRKAYFEVSNLSMKCKIQYCWNDI